MMTERMIHMKFKAITLLSAASLALSGMTLMPANLEAYAVQPAAGCVLTFDANGGTGTMAKVADELDTPYVLPECGFTPPRGKVFTGWKMPNGTVYKPGAVITLNDSLITVTAQYATVISNIAVSGVRTPAAGKKPTYTGFSVSSASGCTAASDLTAGPYHGGVTWRYSKSADYFEEDGTFTAGTSYDIVMILKPKSGYVLPEKPGEVKATLNGKPAFVEFAEDDNGTEYVGIGYMFAGSDFVLGDVDANGKVTADDAQSALMTAIRTLANQESQMNLWELTAADPDGDAAVSVQDAQYILLYSINELAGKNPKWSDIVK